MTDLADLLSEAAPTRRKIGTPEHQLQIRIRVFVRECVAASHVFLAFDRSKKQSKFQHAREKARGIRAGTPDTALVVCGLVLWCELKAGKNTPDDNQIAVGADINVAGGIWFWARSVEEYRRHLVNHGVPLHPNAALSAMHHDALLQGAEMKRKGIVRRPASGGRADKPTASQVRRVEAIRGRTPF